jgi:hypothetical protein
MLLASCATILPGNDPVVVNAERSTQIALDTFNLVEKLEYDTYAALKATDADAAAQVRTFVNRLRRESPGWLASARTLTKAYKGNRTAENKANLDTAIAVLTSATSEANHYIAELNAAKNP